MIRKKNQITIGWNVFQTLILVLQIVFLGKSVIESINYQILMHGLYKLAWNDMECQRIANKDLIPLFIYRSAARWFQYLIYRKEFTKIIIFPVLDMAFIGTAMIVFYILVFPGIGAGDIKLFILLAFYLGKENTLEIVFLSQCYAMVCQVIKIVFQKESLRKTLPMAPFVLLGTITELFLEI